MTSKFLVISNMRSGSTWLTLMLGALDDTHTDYEFKWSPEYEPDPAHFVITGPDFSCGRALESISDKHPVVGSKLTFDDSPLRKSDYAAIASSLEPDIKIIHLTRDYYEILNSIARGAYHMLRDPEMNDDTKMVDAIRRTSWIARWWEELPSELKKKQLSRGQLLGKLKALIGHDLWMGSLAASHAYVRTDYTRVNEDFATLARFVGSASSQEKIKRIVNSPPTIKLPKENVLENNSFIRNACRFGRMVRDLRLGGTGSMVAVGRESDKPKASNQVLGDTADPSMPESLAYTTGLRGAMRRITEAESVGDVVTAGRLSAEAVERYSNNAWSWAKRAGFLADFDAKDASRCLAESLKNNPNSQESLDEIVRALESLSLVMPGQLGAAETYVKAMAHKFPSARILAGLSGILLNEGDIDQARKQAEEALKLSSENLYANLAAFKVAHTEGSFDVSYAYLRKALCIDDWRAYWWLSNAYSGMFLTTLMESQKVAHLASWLDDRKKENIHINHMPHRPTPWHLQQMQQRREELMRKGVPSCLFVAMGKSASVSVGSLFTTGFGLTNVLYSLGHLAIVDSWVNDFAEGGACSVTHLWPTPANIELIRAAGIKKAIIHIRDPRQVLLSTVYHYGKYSRPVHYVRSAGFETMQLEDKIDWVIEKHMRRNVDWILGWIEAEQKLDIKFTTYENFVSDKDRFVEEILSFHDDLRMFFNKENLSLPNYEIDDHFRTGKIDEWRNVFSKEQVELVNNLLPESMCKRFGWRCR